MSSIEQFLQSIRSAILARTVRNDIANAIEQCYDDVHNPTLNTEAMQAAVQAKIDAGQMAGLTIGDGTLTGAKFADGTIPKAKLDPSITFDADSALDTTSTNAIQNKVVTSEINALKADIGDLTELETETKTDLVSAINEAAQSGGGSSDLTEVVDTGISGNIVNPNLFQKLDYYYNTTTGEHRANTYDRVWITPDFIEVGEVPIILYSRAEETYPNTNTLDILCYDASDTYLGATTSIKPFSTTDEQRIILKTGTRKIKMQLPIVTSGCSAAKLCLSFEHLDEFTPYGASEPEVRIKSEYLGEVEETVLNALTDIDTPINLVNPAFMKCWGLKYGTYGGVLGAATEIYQLLKGKINTDGAIDVYIIVNAVPTGGAGNALTINCWDSSDVWLNKVDGSLATTDLQHVTLPSGTAKIAIEVNSPSWYFDAADLCVSFQEIEEFVEYEEVRKLKPALIGNSDDLTFFNKNIVFFGDSIMANRVPDYVRQLTKAHVYQAALGGTSASDRSPSTDSAYAHHLCGYAIAHAINTGDWTTILNAAQGTTRGYDYTRMLMCSEIDWSTIDFIYLHYGANDPYDGSDNANDTMDVTYYAGAMRYIITQIQTAYPNIRIFAGNPIHSPNMPKPNRAQAEVQLKEICATYHVGYIDNFTNLGVNDMTAGTLLKADQIHPNDKGERLLAANIVHNMW